MDPRLSTNHEALHSTLKERCDSCCPDYCWFAHTVVAAVPTSGTSAGAYPDPLNVYYSAWGGLTGSAWAAGSDTAEAACATDSVFGDLCDGTSYYSDTWTHIRTKWDAGTDGSCNWVDNGGTSVTDVIATSGNWLDGGVESWSLTRNTTVEWSMSMSSAGVVSISGANPGAMTWPSPEFEWHDPCDFDGKFSPITDTDSGLTATQAYADWDQTGEVYDSCAEINRTIGPVHQRFQLDLSGSKSLSDKLTKLDDMLAHVDFNDPTKKYYWVTAWKTGYEGLVVDTYVYRTFKEHLPTITGGYYTTRAIIVMYARHASLGQTIFLARSANSFGLPASNAGANFWTAAGTYWWPFGPHATYCLAKAKSRVYVNRGYGTTKPIVCQTDERIYQISGYGDLPCNGSPVPSDTITYVPESSSAETSVIDITSPDFPTGHVNIVFKAVNVKCTFPTQAGFPSPQCDPT